MGIIHQGINKNLVLLIRDKFNIKEFFETGTFYGDTTEWASNHFELVFSSELSCALYEKSKERLEDKNNIKLLQGNSPDHIRKYNTTLQSPIFWLDAHWSNEGTAGQDHECPLIEELIAILESATYLPIILIDDARLFLSPPRHHTTQTNGLIFQILSRHVKST